MKSISKRLSAAVCVVAFICTLGGCTKGETQYDIKADDTYLAGGTIPASSKIFGIIDDSFPMSITNNNDNLSHEDIWTINHYVDLFSSFDDTEGNGVKEDEIRAFLTSYTVDEVIKANNDAGSHHKIVGVQVLQIDVLDENNVEVAFWERGLANTGTDTETSQDFIDVLFFVRADDGKWYENGISHVVSGDTGSFKCVRDDISGKLSIVNAE